MYSLLLLSSLLHITTCTVYTVTSDDHYHPNTTCHHCHNLQHYLLNINKYFTSNTQLLFLPGLHHLHTDLIIQNVHNISLIGSTANFTTDVAVQLQTCMKVILIVNVTRLTMRNMKLFNYKDYQSEITLITLQDCYSILLHHLIVYHHNAFNQLQSLVMINIMGDSILNKVMCFGGIQLIYNETHTYRGNHSLSMNNCTVSTFNINMLQFSYRVVLMIINISKHAQYHDNLFLYNFFIRAEELGINKLLISKCQFVSNVWYHDQLLLTGTSNASIQFFNCYFENYQTYRGPFTHQLITLIRSIKVEFENCYFFGDQILKSYGHNVNPINVFIRNTLSTSISSDDGFPLNIFSLFNTILVLANSVDFQNITSYGHIIYLTGNSTIIIYGTVKFSHNHVMSLINFNNDKKYIIIKVNSTLIASHNKVRELFHTNLDTKYPHPFCFFQYCADLISEATNFKENENFSVIFHNNLCDATCYDSMPTTYCRWLPKSKFNNFIPFEVNKHYIKFINNSGVYKFLQNRKQSSLCVCTDELHYDCNINDLGYLYPGQSLFVPLYNHKVHEITTVTLKTDITQRYVTPCTILDVAENLQYIDKPHCTKLHYTIGFPTDNWCELYIKNESDSDDNLTIFYIRQITCPTGFVKIDKRCQCDPVLVQYGITDCNINDQTILRPANSWISATTRNNSYTYHISLHCPFHYCLPHSSHLNFSTPNSQCQFNRSGLLCGHCQQGLSTVFSSFHCKQCSSIYLLLIIPIATAGVALVLLLFAFNLTVADGTINGFILYVNIISINTPVFFTELNHFTPTYTYISIANLDLGIQTCFYNDMDDYAKMWLQLAFPFYLIFIATLIIITSRYSTTIQRLTARRALPVLATLFLLSYTKILRIVSSVLFFYSTITHLPSKHTTLVWSVDANVPLFGVRFTILLIVCLILFLILVPFNVILLFTRTLSRFRVINRFKPLLDTYQGPYKNKYYYWTGLQLLIRAVFFGISSLDRNISFTVSIILLGILVGMHGIIQPLKMKCKNYQELVLLLNLQALYAISLYYQDGNNLTIIPIMISMAVIQFTFIITYHMITYVCGGVIRNKIQLSINTFTGWIIRLHKESQPQHFQLENNIRENIPEVAFKYHEFREPLLDQDQ